MRHNSYVVVAIFFFLFPRVLSCSLLLRSMWSHHNTDSDKSCQNSTTNRSIGVFVVVGR